MVLSFNNHWFKDILHSDRHIAFSFASCNMPVFMQNILSPKVIAFKRHAISTIKYKSRSANLVNLRNSILSRYLTKVSLGIAFVLSTLFLESRVFKTFSASSLRSTRYLTLCTLLLPVQLQSNVLSKNTSQLSEAQYSIQFLPKFLAEAEEDCQG